MDACLQVPINPNVKPESFEASRPIPECQPEGTEAPHPEFPESNGHQPGLGHLLQGIPARGFETQHQGQLPSGKEFGEFLTQAKKAPVTETFEYSTLRPEGFEENQHDPVLQNQMAPDYWPGEVQSKELGPQHLEDVQFEPHDFDSSQFAPHDLEGKRDGREAYGSSQGFCFDGNAVNTSPPTIIEPLLERRECYMKAFERGFMAGLSRVSEGKDVM